jgi:hypothetical protein
MEEGDQEGNVAPEVRKLIETYMRMDESAQQAFLAYISGATEK